MNLDYVREVVNDRDIDIPFARHALVAQAALEIRAEAEKRPVPALLWGAYIMLISSPNANQVRKVVDDLCAVMDERFGDVHAVGIPDEHAHPALAPEAENRLAVAADHFPQIAAILRALDLLSWVMAYDEIEPPVFEDDDTEDECASKPLPCGRPCSQGGR